MLTRLVHMPFLAASIALFNLAMSSDRTVRLILFGISLPS